MSEDFKASTLASGKLNNCGVIQLKLDPTKGLLGGPIIDGKLMFDSKLEVDPGLWAACSAPDTIREEEFEYSRDNSPEGQYEDFSADNEQILGNRPL